MRRHGPSWSRKADAITGNVTEYKMPNPKARDPHTIAMLQDGRVFFTVQAGNFIGTLDPKAPDGAIKLVESPRVNSRKFLTWPIPGGGGTVRNMEIDKQGNLWLAESGVGKISRVTITPGKRTQ